MAGLRTLPEALARGADSDAGYWFAGSQGERWRSYAELRQGALRAAISEKLREGRVIVLQNLDLPSHKTADFANTLDTLGVRAGALILDEPIGRNLDLAARNLPRCKVLRSTSLNIVDLLKYEYLVMSSSAARKLAEVLGS